MFSPFIKHLREITPAAIPISSFCYHSYYYLLLIFLYLLLLPPWHKSWTRRTTHSSWFECFAIEMSISLQMGQLTCFRSAFPLLLSFYSTSLLSSQENRVACFRAGKEGGLSLNHPEQLQGRKKLSYTCIALLLRMWRGGPVLGLGMRGLSLKVQRYLGELIHYSYIVMNYGMVIESMNLSRYILKLWKWHQLGSREL